MIIYCCHDLLFASKISGTCDALKAISRPARNAKMLQARLDQVDDGKANEPISAVLIDLEKGDAAIDLITQAKSHENAPPVLAWGPHVEVERLRQAKDAGADVVMARGAFSSQLPEIITGYAPA